MQNRLDTSVMVPIATGFPLYPFQEKWLSNYFSEKIVNLRGGRATGRTSIGLALLVLDAITCPNQTAVVYCSSDGIARSHKARALEMIEKVNEWLEIPDLVIRSNAHEIQLYSRSTLIFGSNPLMFRGRMLTHVFIDAFNLEEIDDLDRELFHLIVPCLAAINSKLLISTGE